MGRFEPPDGDITDITYSYDPEADFALPEGATSGWLCLSDGQPGPARAVKVVAFTDPEGNGFVEQVGDWRDVTVVDDRKGER